MGKENMNMHINHPNLYFDRSRQLERSETKDKEVVNTGSSSIVVLIHSVIKYRKYKYKCQLK